MRFPDPNEIARLASSEEEREALCAEYAAGLAYYVDRVDRLMLAGDRVLDAGCSAGPWSIALAQRFREVKALDPDANRLAVLRAVAERMGVMNIDAAPGPLGQLPYDSSAFDAVFSYRVIMFVRAEQVLREFHRVLRPGGRAYLCVNADGWSRSLADEKGKAGPQSRDAARSTLYTTYWQRALAQGLHEALQRDAMDFPEGLLPWENRLLFKVQRRLTRWARQGMAALGGADWKRSKARDCLCRSKAGRELLRRVRGLCGEAFLPCLLDDVTALLQSQTVPCRFGVARAYRPEEFESLARQAGFADFQWAVEGGLTCDWFIDAPPRYAGYFGEELSVWECLMVKPDRPVPMVVLDAHYRAAREAAATPLLAESAADPVLSNRSSLTFPAPLVAFARWHGEALGGEGYLRRLARTIAEEAGDEEEIVRRTIRFVQKAVFRDPVVQPLADDGSLPDALTSLLCARGRCGHTAQILADLCRHAGLETRVRQFPQHLVAEIRCNARWVVADADVFKGGIIPQNDHGRLLTLEEIEAQPYVLDRFPPTGWMIRPRSRFTRGLLGRQVRGYVDALEPDQRGFVSGYYVPTAWGHPPSLPAIRRFEARAGRAELCWTPSRVKEGRLLGYRARIGTRSRAWTYDEVCWAEAPLAATPGDVAEAETSETGLQSPVPPGVKRLFASVTAISDRIEKEPRTFFWPSEEAVCDVA